MNFICKLFGHTPVGLNTKRKFATCKRCGMGLIVGYDMSYGDTVVMGDYGDQKMFLWCSCGNELNSTHGHRSCVLSDKGEFCRFECSRCGAKSKWDLNAPVPIEIL